MAVKLIARAIAPSEPITPFHRRAEGAHAERPCAPSCAERPRRKEFLEAELTPKRK